MFFHENCRNKHKKKGLQCLLYNAGSKRRRESVYLLSRDNWMIPDCKLYCLFRQELSPIFSTLSRWNCKVLRQDGDLAREISAKTDKK